MAELKPSSGPALGGTVVTVNGFGFVESHLCVCRFGTHKDADVSFVSSTRILCTSPPGFGVQKVEVSSNGQNYVDIDSAFDFHYQGLFAEISH